MRLASWIVATTQVPWQWVLACPHRPSRWGNFGGRRSPRRCPPELSETSARALPTGAHVTRQRHSPELSEALAVTKQTVPTAPNQREQRQLVEAVSVDLDGSVDRRWTTPWMVAPCE